MRALFVHWPRAMKEPDSLLSDLAKWTDIDAVILSHTYFSFDGRENHDPLVLPSTDVFDDLPVQTVTATEFDVLVGFADLAKANGFKVGCNLSAIRPNSIDLAPLGCIDVTGRRVVGGRSSVYGCPNNPDTLRFGTRLVREIVATWASLDTIDFNHLEYPHWPRSGLRDLFVCFCDHCRDKAEAEGIDFDGVQRDAESLYDALISPAAYIATPPTGLSANDLLSFLVERPQIATWLNFRASSMSEFTRQVTQAGREAAKEHNPDLEIGASFHLPAISRLVGTDFRAHYRLFDWVSPKFPDYVPGTVIPRIADEIGSRSGRWDISELRQAIRDLYDLGPGPDEYRPIASPKEELLYSNTFDTAIIDRQMRHLEPLMGKVPMFPWVWLYNRDLDDLMEKVASLREHGFGGYFLWSWEWDQTDEALKESAGTF